MNRSLILLCLLTLSIGLDAQEKKALTLQQAVMEQRSTFAPENIDGLNWIPGTEQYSYVIEKNGDSFLMRGYLDDRPDEAILSEQGLSSAFTSTGRPAPKRFPRIQWADSVGLHFSSGGKSWHYDTATSLLTEQLSVMDTGENADRSPDGSKIAFTIGDDLFWTEEGKDSLRITSVHADGVVAGKAVHRYEFGIRKGTFWSPKSDKLAFYLNDQTMVTRYPLVDYGGIPATDSPIIYPMAGQTSEQVQLMVYDFKEYRAVRLETGPLSDDYLTNVTWGPEGEYIYIAHLDRGQDHMRLIKYDATTGKPVATLLEERDEQYVEPEHGPYFLEGGDGEFLWWSERDGYQHLYRYDAEGGLLGQVTSGPRVILGIEHYDPASGELFVSGTDAAIERVLYKVSISGGEMKRLTSEQGTHSTKLDRTKGYYIDSFTSVAEPRTVSIHDRDGGLVKMLLKADDPLKDVVHATTELIVIEAKDGTELHARMIKPSDFDATKRYPVLVYVYGGPHAQMVNDRWLGGAPLWMHVAAERGMIVFTVDGRGSANRGLEFEQAVHRRLGTVELQDQLAGADYLKTLPYVDADRMAVHGWSFGGFMTTTMMLKAPGTFQAGVAGGPVTDWSMYEVMYTERYMDTPEENPNGYKTSRLHDSVKGLEGDLLLIHGTSDDVVVMQHSMSLLKSFVDEGVQVDFFPYPGHPHNVRGQDRVHLMTKVLDYIGDKLALENQ